MPWPVFSQNSNFTCAGDAFEGVFEAKSPIAVVGEQSGERMSGEAMVAINFHVLVGLRQAFLPRFGADIRFRFVASCQRAG